MNGEIDRLDGQSSDEASSRNDPANPENPASAVERKRPASGNASANPQQTRKTKAGASASKRKKPFVL
jgi:hypothetical protein